MGLKSIQVFFFLDLEQQQNELNVPAYDDVPVSSYKERARRGGGKCKYHLQIQPK